jgi:hypothetical protein
MHPTLSLVTKIPDFCSVSKNSLRLNTAPLILQKSDISMAIKRGLNSIGVIKRLVAALIPLVFVQKNMIFLLIFCKYGKKKNRYQ